MTAIGMERGQHLAQESSSRLSERAAVGSCSFFMASLLTQDSDGSARNDVAKRSFDKLFAKRWTCLQQFKHPFKLAWPISTSSLIQLLLSILSA
jgi:hypothetical protein